MGFERQEPRARLRLGEHLQHCFQPPLVPRLTRFAVLPDRISLDRMSKSFAAPRTIRRIAARRVFQSRNGKPVVLTLGVPQRVPGSDWGCPLQITGLNATWRRPRYVFGIDGLQALHLAMQCAGALLESAKLRLEWLGQPEDLGMPKFLPSLPKPQQDRLEAMVEREAIKFWCGVERAHKAKRSKRSHRTKASKTADKT
jgi:hypothetical protein